MKRLNKFLCIFVTSVMIISNLCNINVFASSSDESSKRISGKDRYETSVFVAEEGWKDGSENVVVASGEDFADALCAAPLAKLKDAPILLTNKDKLNADVKEEIKKLNAKNVIIVGGEGAVSSEVENEIKDIETIKNLERISGKDRYETSLKVAEKLGQVNYVSIATGLDYADALSIASIAAHKKMPILLVSKNNMRSDIKNYINKIENLNKVYVLGGRGVISESICEKIPKTKQVRLYGNNRYETNVSIMNEFKNELNFKKVYVVTALGDNSFADALSGAVLASMTHSPLVLVGKSVDEKTQKFISEEFPTNSKIAVIGGKGAVPDKVVDKINENIKETEGTKSTKKHKSKSHDDSPSSKDDIKVSVEVNKNNMITLKVTNVVDRQLTMTLYDQKGNLVHVGESTGRFAVTDENLKDGEYKYEFSLDKGVYHGYIYGEKAGMIKINTFTVK